MDEESFAKYARTIAELEPEQRDALALALATRDDEIVATIMAFDGETPVGHAALRRGPDPDSLEVKKVFVAVQQRGRGIARALMLSLEEIARERGASTLVLQTGTLQHEAISLYEKLGYAGIPAYGLYGAVPFALCFSKNLERTRGPGS